MRKLSKLDGDGYLTGKKDPKGMNDGMSKSQVKQAAKKSNKKPSKKSMPKVMNSKCK